MVLIAPLFAECALASESATDRAALVDELVALPDHAARRARIAERLAASADADLIARLSVASQTLAALDSTGRTDPSVVRLFLTAALADDPAQRQAALDNARAGGDPPLGVVPSAPLPPPPALAEAHAPDPSALRDYNSRHLKRDTITFVTGSATKTGGWMATTVTWAVFDGGGAPLPTKTFAQRVGDSRTLGELSLRRNKAWTWLGVGIGTSLVGTGALAYYMTELQRAPYDSVAARQASNGAYVSMVPMFGGMLVCLYPAHLFQTQQHVSQFYSPSEADKWIDGYNTKLREELELAPEDVSDIDLGSR